MENYDIDFVILWVDGNDTKWRNQKEFYWKNNDHKTVADSNQKARFRDWENLQYWFRGVEAFAPWVRRIFFVTWGHLPKWLNTEHPKLEIVNHKDFIPSRYLPVFSPNPIETNFHRIAGLSEHFVYFNDDMFLIKPVKKSDFFVNGLPREMAVSYLLTNDGKNDTFKYMLFRMMGEVNQHFDFHSCVKKNLGKWFTPRYGKAVINNILLYRFKNLSGLYTPHVPSSLRKSIIKEVWRELEIPLNETCSHRFRDSRDITQYIFRYWTIMQGEFEPSNIYQYSKEFFLTSANSADDNMLFETIEKQKAKMICINDSSELDDFETVKERVKQSFQSILGRKSAFEK